MKRSLLLHLAGKVTTFRKSTARTRLAISFSLVALAILFGIAGFLVPVFAYHDKDVGLTAGQIDRLKQSTESYGRTKDSLFATTRQVVEGVPEPDEGMGEYPDGVVVWRTYFGIEYGRTTSIGQVQTQWDDGALKKAVLLFIPTELALWVLAALLVPWELLGVASSLRKKARSGLKPRLWGPP